MRVGHPRKPATSNCRLAAHHYITAFTPPPPLTCELRPKLQDSPLSSTTAVWWRPPHAAQQTTHTFRFAWLLLAHSLMHSTKLASQGSCRYRITWPQALSLTSHHLLASQSWDRCGCVALQQVTLTQLAFLQNTSTAWHSTPQHDTACYNTSQRH
jgi:hypothetical protein